MIIEIPKWMIILKAISESDESLNRIVNKNNITFAHGHKIMKEMENYRLIKIRKEGRRNIIVLTEKGTKIAESISIVLDELYIDKYPNTEYERFGLK